MRTTENVVGMQESGHVKRTQLTTAAQRHGYDTQLRAREIEAGTLERNVRTQVSGQRHIADRNYDGRVAEATAFERANQVTQNSLRDRDAIRARGQHEITKEYASSQRHAADRNLEGKLARYGSLERSAQVREKSETERTRLATDAQQRGYATQLRARQHEADSLERSVQVREKSETERTRIKAKTMLEIERAKYAIDYKITKAHEQGVIHLSNNNYNALCLQAQHTAAALRHSKEVEKAIALGVSRNELEAVKYKAQLNYDVEIKNLQKGEKIHYSTEERKRIEDTNRTRRLMFRSLCESRALIAQEQEKTKRQGYVAIGDSIKYATEVMKEQGSSYVEVDSRASNGVGVSTRIRSFKKK